MIKKFKKNLPITDSLILGMLKCAWICPSNSADTANNLFFKFSRCFLNNYFVNEYHITAAGGR